MKKHLLTLLTTAAFISLMTGCGAASGSTSESSDTQAQTSEEQITVRIADVPGFFPLAIADAKGYLEEELAPLNATAEVISYEGGGPAITESFTAGELDIALIGDLPTDTAIANGTEISIIAYSQNKEKATAFTVKEGSGIEKIEDLKGKKIGVSIGQLSHGELLKNLENHGLSADDVEIVNLSNNDILTAIETGDIDAGASYIDRVENANENGSHLVSIGDGQGLGFANIVVAARNDFTKEYPEITAAVLRAFDKANQFKADEANKDEVISIVSQASNFSENIIELTYPAFDCYLTIGENELNKFQTVLDFAYDQELISDPLTTDTTVDMTYLELAGLE